MSIDTKTSPLIILGLDSGDGLFVERKPSSHRLCGRCGPTILARGAIGDVSPLDLAPTFLSLLGEPTPEKLSGKLVEAVAHG